MKTAEYILEKYLPTPENNEDANAIIQAMEEYANQFKSQSIKEEVSIEDLAKEVIDKRFLGSITLPALELSAKHTAEHLLDNFNISRKQPQLLKK